MKLTISYLALASVASIAAASSCTSDVALSWPFTPEEDGSDDGPVGTNSGGDGTTCNGDINCEAIAAEGQCNSLGLVSDEDSTCAEKLKMLKRTVDLDCSSNESCLAFVDDSLLCMDVETGDYHDDVGGSGNAFSGVYTAPDGKVQTVTGVTAEPTSTATARGDDNTASESTRSTSASQTGTEAATAAAQSTSGSSSTSQSSSASQSAAAAESTGGAEQQAKMLSALLVVAVVPAIAAVL